MPLALLPQSPKRIRHSRIRLGDSFFLPKNVPLYFFTLLHIVRLCDQWWLRPPPPLGVHSRFHNIGKAPGGSAAGEVPAYTQPQSLRKDDTGVIAKRERGSRYGVSVPFRATGPTTAVVALRLDRAASQLLSAGPCRQEAPERSYGHCAGIA